MPTEWERTQRRLQAEAEFEQRESDVRERNDVIGARISQLQSILVSGVQNTPSLDYERRLLPIPSVASVPAPRQEPEPAQVDFLPREPSVLSRAIPGWESRYRVKQEKGRARHRAAHSAWKRRGDDERLRYSERVADVESRAAAAVAENELILKHQADGRSGAQKGVEDYILWALGRSEYPFNLTVSARYLPSRRELLVELEYPSVEDVIPELSQWVHVKGRKSVEPKSRTREDRNRRYKQLIAQVTLRALYECFQVDSYSHIEKISFKGHVRGVSPVTGRPVRPPVVSLRVEREEFLDRNFLQVDAVKLLQNFRANVSDQPTELKPVPLVVEFDISDPRLIEEEDVLSRLDDRDNLLDLTAAQFEAVITNLFNRMGYEAYPTIRSKDGGVDCIAYFRDPVGVIKCVIQAKKWTITVGVDAVRDLAGAMDHERASKGILVTTSRVAPAGKKFVEGKPMQLIEGQELLDLFEKYTDRRVTIVFPPK